MENDNSGGKNVSGLNLNDRQPSLKEIIDSFKTTGFQATNLSRAIEILNAMTLCRNMEFKNLNNEHLPYVPKTNCTIFLAYTSNMVSCGVREYIKYLVKSKKIDVLITTAGGIEEDFIKCLAPTLMGDFNLDGAKLRDQGLNRIGNLLIPSQNYAYFEDWVTPFLNEMLEKQKSENFTWSPSKIINFLGSKINCQDSIYYWAHINKIPVFCPAITDGALGDMIYFNEIKNPGLKIDVVEAKFSQNTGMIILGGGVIKHHTLYVNTAVEYDGSDSGASPDEAVSWGKIKKDAMHIKVFGDASVLFPLLVVGSNLFTVDNF